jgi:hypothetical protein
LLAGVAFVPMLVATVVALNAGPGADAVVQISWLLFGAMPIAALAAFHETAPAVRPGRWLLALPVGVVALTAVVSLAQAGGGSVSVYYLLVSGSGLWCTGLTVAGMITVAAVVRESPRTPAWPLALTLLAVPVLILHGLTIIDVLGMTATPSSYPRLEIVGAAQCLALVIATVSALLLAASRPRRWRAGARHRS